MLCGAKLKVKQMQNNRQKLSKRERPKRLETTLSVSPLFECYKKNGHENYVSKLFCFLDLLQILLFWQKKNQNEVLPEFSYAYIPKYRGETVRAHCHALDNVTLLKEMMMANINRYLIRCQLLFKSSVCII